MLKITDRNSHQRCYINNDINNDKIMVKVNENSDINNGKSNDKNYDKNNVLSKFGSFLWFHREI